MAEPLMDDNEIKNNNCFWLNKDTKKTETIRSQNEVFLYDEAEPLAYGCSETSLPPKVTSFELSVRTEESKIPSEKLSVTSALCRNKSEYYSVQSLSKNMKKPKLLVEPESGRVVWTNNFQNAILSKYNEFSEISTKSLSQHETEYFKNSTDDCENCDSSCSTKILSKRKSSKMREIYNRKSQIFDSSSDSEADRSLEIHSDEVFSTGASDIAEDVQRVRCKSVDRTKKANSIHNKKATERDEQEVRVNSKNSDIQWLTSKSIVKMVTPVTRRETRDTSPKRVYAPQRKISVKRMDANAKPCNLLVEEIKRNNLVMREEIFSSSKSRNHVITDSHLQCGKMKSEFEEEGFKKVVKEQLVSHKAKNDGMEVFEAKGCSGSRWSPVKTLGIIRDAKAGPQSKPGSFETANSQMQEVQNKQVECTEGKTSGYSEQVKVSSTPEKADLPQQVSTMKSIGTNTSESAHSQSVSANQISNGSRQSTPNCGTSRYVKLPGLTEAFMRDDKCVQELRIKDGISFESANVLSSLNVAHDSSQSKIVFLEQKSTDDLEGVPALKPEQKIAMEMKDQSTGFESPMEDRLTQTLNMLTTADTSVQCESHIIDSLNGNSDYRNDHQEIMICNDEGTGVQLYNILGHPLTDMEGYLLKDSHGRFLVRFDNFGVPTACTDGKTIFLEDGTKWEHIKGYFNIIHQRFKKKMQRSLERNKMKSKIDHRSKRPIENAKRVSNKLERLANISQYDASTDGNSSQCFEVRHDQNPLRKLKFKNESANMYGNSTSTLVAEMKSIAKLRNALLEKINFIADRGPQRRRFPTKNETRSYKSMRKTENSNETNWKSEPRINSDRGRIQRNSNKWIRNVRRDMDEERLPKDKTIQCRHSSRVSPLCIQNNQVESAATSSVWRPEPLAALHVNSRWLPQPESSTTLTVLRDENFPTVSDHSTFELWSDVSRSNSHFQSMTEKTQKWNAMMPSIEVDSEETGF